MSSHYCIPGAARPEAARAPARPAESAPSDLLALLACFAPDPARLPDVSVQLMPLNSYDVLMEAAVDTGVDVSVEVAA